MGEIADDHYDRFCEELYGYDDRDAYERMPRTYPVRNDLVCHHCGATGLRWTAVGNRWRVGDGTTEHQCNNANTAEGFEDVA